MVEKMSELGQTSRASNALLKRQEAIKRWMISDTNRQSLHRPSNKVRITFERETVFLSAVSGGDADETKKLIDSGVDINCANVDGLTGLHQACIDENVEMVELLVNSGAYLDARDDEGWTPLHAAASAGNVQIAQVLLDKGADLLAVNNEGEIPCDLAEEEEMDEFLEEEMEKLGVEPDEIRNQEEQQMLEDATSWVNSNQVDEQYNFQGASALHVAAAKGYHKVIKLLIQAGSEVNSRDADGWTPLHAAVHWGQLDAAEILTEAGADFNLRNNIGQTPCDLADGDMMKSAEELRKKAKDLAKDGLLQRSNKIIDDNTHKRKLSLSKNKDRKALQDFSNYVHDSNAKPSKSALKGSRQQHKKAENDTNEASDESEDESGESDASESENENRPVNTAPTSVILSTPLRPSALTRPPTTASNEKVSTQRNPLIGSAPMRPPSLSKDNEKRDEHKEESIGVRVNRFKQRNEDASTTKPAEIGREVKFNIARPPGARGDDKDSSSAPNFNILRPGSTTKATEEKDNVSTFKISRPGSREADNKSSDNSTKSSFNILRPSSLRNGDKSTPAKDDGSSSTTKIDDLRSRIGPPSRPSRKDEREDDKRNATTPTASSKADEIRAKFNIPRPGDTQSAASTALSRFRERKSEMESEDNKSKNNEKGDEGKKITSGTKVEEPPPSRARKLPFAEPLRPSRTSATSDTRDEKPDSSELPSSYSSRGRHVREHDKDETISIRKRLADRRETSTDKDREAAEIDRDKKDEDEDNSLLSAQRARRSRRPREKRKATGVAYMPGEDEDEDEEKKETRFNTRSNEENENRKANPMSVEDEPPRMSLAERLRRSRENREGISSGTGLSSLSSNRNRDIGSSLSKSPSVDISDPRELQRKLRDALHEADDYKNKLDRANKEKDELRDRLAQYEEAVKERDELRDKLVQCEEAMKKMKDENGALIRVISTLTRSNSS